MEMVLAKVMDISIYQTAKGWVVYMCSGEEEVS